MLNSAVEVRNGAFSAQTYHLSEKIELNQTYTATIWGELDSSKNEYTMYIEDQKGAPFIVMEKVSDGIYRGSGKLANWDIASKEEHADIIQIIPRPYGSITGANTIHRIKLEPGTVTDPVWTPAPEDVLLKGEVDGRNLFSFSKNYKFSNATIEKDNAINGIIIKNILADTSDGRRYARINNISGLLKGSYYTISGEIYAKQNIDAAFDLSDGNLSDIIHVTNSPQKFFVTVKSGIYGNFVDISFETVSDSLEVYIKDFKIEPGINPNPHWTPAPEDVVVRSELDALIKRIDALEKQVGITSADSFMELPSADVMESGSETASADEAAEDVEIN